MEIREVSVRVKMSAADDVLPTADSFRTYSKVRVHLSVVTGMGCNGTPFLVADTAPAGITIRIELIHYARASRHDFTFDVTTACEQSFDLDTNFRRYERVTYPQERHRTHPNLTRTS